MEFLIKGRRERAELINTHTERERDLVIFGTEREREREKEGEESFLIKPGAVCAVCVREREFEIYTKGSAVPLLCMLVFHFRPARVLIPRVPVFPLLRLMGAGCGKTLYYY